MAFFTGIIVSIVVAILASLYYRWSTKNKQFLDRFPGPPTVPILGNVLDFKSTTQILDLLISYHKKFGGIVKVRMGPFKASLFVIDYKFLEQVLSSTKILDKTDDYNFLLPWLGTGLLTSTGPKWKKHRRVLTPAFHFQILEQFIEIFESGGNKLLTKLEYEVGKASTDIYPFVTLCTLDIICETAMGTKVNAQDFGESEYVQSVKEMCRIIIERSIKLFEMWDVTYPLSKNYSIQKKALKILHGKTNSVIGQRQKELRDIKNKTIQQDDAGIKRKKAFLDLLLDATVDGRPLTQEEIREEVDTFMFEGHDTTASAISFALFCLANHPDVQERVLEEQKILFENQGNPSPTYTDLQSMKYLEQVIKETLRLYPSVPLYGRKTTEPVEFSGTIVPKDIIISIFTYGLHRNPEYFPEPETFNPSRFDEIDGTQPYSFLPFSAGPRNCIGQKFAMLEMKSAISKIVRKFELLPAVPEHKLVLAAETVLKSANGIKIRLKLRN